MLTGRPASESVREEGTHVVVSLPGGRGRSGRRGGRFGLHHPRCAMDRPLSRWFRQQKDTYPPPNPAPPPHNPEPITPIPCHRR